jgi:hypothetical protein
MQLKPYEKTWLQEGESTAVPIRVCANFTSVHYASRLAVESFGGRNHYIGRS